MATPRLSETLITVIETGFALRLIGYVNVWFRGPVKFLPVTGASRWQKEGVYNVHTFRFGSGRISAGLARIAYVFWTSQCLQGLECGSSPTSGTVDPLVRGVFALTCVQSLCSRPSDASCAGCGLAAAMAYLGVWVAGSGSWLVGAPPAVAWFRGSSFRFCRVGRGWPTPVHG